MADRAAVTWGTGEIVRTRSAEEPRAGEFLALPTGASVAIRRVNQLITQVALFDSNVLILGESGTGKEVVARAIHDASPRRLRPYVPINCGAIPAELLESELFGHEKGAFTGALNARKGRFEIAEGGTVFLDEIGDMNPTMQVKLLRVLQERVYERVGSCVSQRCDVRIIAATHRDLEQAIARGTFREDLFYRLNVVPVEMPALRERGEDLPLLIAALSERIAATGRPQVQFTAAAVEALRGYRWPGNVRELGNLIERLSIQCGSRAVGIADLPARYRPADWTPAGEPLAEDLIASVPATRVLAEAFATLGQSTPSPSPSPHATDALDILGADGADDDIETTVPMDGLLVDALLAELPRGFDLREYLDGLEQRLIQRAMHSADGVVAHAARLLGLRRTTLVEKLRKYALTGSDSASET
jgi:sigma-54 dependent transcriptional regulator, flagellar regulatory protein